ncbi:cylicin-2-like [Mizuhopecten yessoensis]|uniref:cylicin-2-like n=1 Tax=Mizuhopecten yessoensis TaxID=6573 RepID=UPI000B45A785|nr:cylicin-2-like [Mizuhopecten yessoensis]
MEGKFTSPKPPRGSSPSQSDIEDENDEVTRASGEAPEEKLNKRGSKNAWKKGGREGEMEGKFTSPKPPRGSSPSKSDIEDENDEVTRASGEAPEEKLNKRGSKNAWKKGGRKGEMEGKFTSPKPPRGSSPSQSDIEDEDDEERGMLLRILNVLRGSKNTWKKGGKKGEIEGKSTSPKPPRGTSPSPSDDAPEEKVDKRGKQGNKEEMEGTPSSPKPPRGTNVGKKSLKIEIDGFLDKVKSHMKRRF